RHLRGAGGLRPRPPVRVPGADPPDGPRVPGVVGVSAVARLRSDLGQLGSILAPSSARTFLQAGMLGWREGVALGIAMPWYLGRGPSLGFVSAVNAMAVGSKPAIHDRHGTLTWSEVDRRANRMANALAAMGLRGGDRLA